MRHAKAVAVTSVLGVYVSLVVGAGTASAADPAPTSFAMPVVLDGPVPAAGSRVGFSGQLRSGAAPVGGKPVQLWVRSAGRQVFVLAATTTTDTRGQAYARVVLTRNSVTRWVFSGDAEYGPSQTNDVLQAVATRVGARVNDRTVSVGQRLVVRGTTFPAKPGHIVSLWSGTAPDGFVRLRKPPTRLADATVRADGSYRLVERFHKVGGRKLFVRVSGGDGNVRGFSPYRYVRIG